MTSDVDEGQAMLSDAGARSGGAEPAAGRVVASWGAVFVVLLLVSAGMVTVPGGRDPVAFVRQFYEDHRAVIAVAQLTGVAASAAFIPFALGLPRQHWVGHHHRLLRGCGVAVAVAGVLASVPPLALCAVADSAGSRATSALATASDLVDVVLFAVIAAFAGAVTLAVDRLWVRALAAVVAVVCGARAVLVLVGGEALELVAPVAFLLLVVSLAVLCWPRARPRAT